MAKRYKIADCRDNSGFLFYLACYSDGEQFIVFGIAARELPGARKWIVAALNQ